MTGDVFDRALTLHGGLIDSIAASFEVDHARREDLRQDIAIALWRAVPAWRQDCSLRTFVARVAHNVGVSHVRRAVRAPRGEPLEPALAETQAATAETPDTAALRADQRRRLALAVAELPPALRDVAVLMLEGFAPPEIADTLGINEGTVNTRASRARAALRARMNGHER